MSLRSSGRSRCRSRNVRPIFRGVPPRTRDVLACFGGILTWLRDIRRRPRNIPRRGRNGSPPFPPANGRRTPGNQPLLPASGSLIPASPRLLPVPEALRPGYEGLPPGNQRLPPGNLPLPPGNERLPPKRPALPPGGQPSRPGNGWLRLGNLRLPPGRPSLRPGSGRFGLGRRRPPHKPRRARLLRDHRAEGNRPSPVKNGLGKPATWRRSMGPPLTRRIRAYARRFAEARGAERSCVAVTVPAVPPRTAKSPVTVNLRGSRTATRSSRMVLTTDS